MLYSVCWSLSLSLSLSLCRRFPVLPHQKLSFRKKPFPSSSPKSVMHCRCPVCIVSFLCSFSWTSFHLLDSSMRLAHSHSHSLTLCNSLSLSLSLCVWCTILAFLCSIHFILLPSSLPASSFPFALCPALAADLPLLYIMVLSSQYAVPVLVHIISSRAILTFLCSMHTTLSSHPFNCLYPCRSI